MLQDRHQLRLSRSERAESYPTLVVTRTEHSQAGLIALLLSCWSARAIERADSWLNQTAGPRPKYVWENREDTLYHEMWYSDTNKVHAPEVQAIMRGPWVFNRAMKWLEAGNDTLIAFSDAGNLPLTGERQVSRWYSDPANESRFRRLRP
jgi:hypothetical protein